RPKPSPTSVSPGSGGGWWSPMGCLLAGGGVDDKAEPVVIGAVPHRKCRVSLPVALDDLRQAQRFGLGNEPGSQPDAETSQVPQCCGAHRVAAANRFQGCQDTAPVPQLAPGHDNSDGGLDE